MSLKEQIVVVNEYTLKMANGEGSRGSTPGNYVPGYMARKGSAEELTPVQFDAEDYILRYSARKNATEAASSVQDVKRNFRKIQGKGGLAFGNGDPSLSHTKLMDLSKDIQTQFDNGKTVLKTVLSFTEEYLKEMQVVDAEFIHQGRGSYRGKLDQMKLRLAIMNGVRHLGGLYDDLSYVGVIQVDTNYVHCHLTMVDKGVGYIMEDGTQKGKMSQNAMNKIRRGVDNQLRNMMPVRNLSNDITKDRANVKAFMKRHTHQKAQERGFFQAVFAALPSDKRLWRASTNRKEMKGANAMVRSYVEGVFSEPDSGYQQAVKNIREYATFRVDREGLGPKEYRTFIKDGKERLTKEAINSVYSILKQIPEEERIIRTPLLDASVIDLDELQQVKREDPMLDFAFKLKSYAGRLTHHKEEGKKYYEAAVSFQALNKEQVSPQANVMGIFYKEEEEYHKKCLSKYQNLLRFLPAPTWVTSDFQKLGEKRRLESGIVRMLKDTALRQVPPDMAEEMARMQYDVIGGHLVKNTPFILERQLETQREEIQAFEQIFNEKLSWEGLCLTDKGIKQETMYSFEEVKAIDLHHIEHDFPYDIEISPLDTQIFKEQANRRFQAFEDARMYLILTNQEDALTSFASADIVHMQQLSEQLQSQSIIKTNALLDDVYGRGPTISLDNDFQEEIHKSIQNVIDEKILE